MCAVGLNGSDRPETVLNMIVEMHVWSLSGKETTACSTWGHPGREPPVWRSRPSRGGIPVGAMLLCWYLLVIGVIVGYHSW